MKTVVRIIGGINVRTSFGTLSGLFKSLQNGETITLPPWLQRKLQESEWFNKKRKKAKAYMSSAIRGTLRFEPFTIVDINLLISELKRQLQKLDEDKVEEKAEIEKSIKHIESKPGAKFVIIDGQSRGYLAIVPFFTNKIPYGEVLTMQKVREDDNSVVDEFELKNEYFKDMPDWVREEIFGMRYIKNRIVGGSLSEIVKALISKQEGVSWWNFQMLYAEHSFTPLFIRIRNNITKPIQDFYVKVLKEVPKMYNDEVNGLEFVLTNWALYFRDKSFPNISKIERTCEYKDDAPSNAILKKIKDYLNEYRKYWTGIKTDKKVKFKFWFTYAAFRDLIDNGDSTDRYYKQFGINDSFNILVNNKFCEWATKVHETLLSKKDKNAYTNHWEKSKLPNGKVKTKAKEGGYPASYGSDEDEKILNRLHWLVKCFKRDKQYLLDNSIISVKTDMPDLIDVIIDNDYKDADDIEIDFREPYDRGHEDPSSISGDNSIDNLVPQKPKDNKQYSDTPIVR